MHLSKPALRTLCVFVCLLWALSARAERPTCQARSLAGKDLRIEIEPKRVTKWCLSYVVKRRGRVLQRGQRTARCGNRSGIFLLAADGRTVVFVNQWPCLHRVRSAVSGTFGDPTLNDPGQLIAVEIFRDGKSIKRYRLGDLPRPKGALPHKRYASQFSHPFSRIAPIRLFTKAPTLTATELRLQTSERQYSIRLSDGKLARAKPAMRGK
jgi:hypothetical protein